LIEADPPVDVDINFPADNSMVNGEKNSRIIVGPPKLTRYERARIIGARALQISMGAPILIALPENVKDPLEIARLELEKGILPITIRRRKPGGGWQDIPLKWLLK